MFEYNSYWKMKDKNNNYNRSASNSASILWIWFIKLLAFQTSITSRDDDKCVSLALIMNGFLAVALYYFV